MTGILDYLKMTDRVKKIFCQYFFRLSLALLSIKKYNYKKIKKRSPHENTTIYSLLFLVQIVCVYAIGVDTTFEYTQVSAPGFKEDRIVKTIWSFFFNFFTLSFDSKVKLIVKTDSKQGFAR